MYMKREGRCDLIFKDSFSVKYLGVEIISVPD
jgi:hypothetical protein